MMMMMMMMMMIMMMMILSECPFQLECTLCDETTTLSRSKNFVQQVCSNVSYITMVGLGGLVVGLLRKP